MQNVYNKTIGSLEKKEHVLTLTLTFYRHKIPPEAQL